MQEVVNKVVQAGSILRVIPVITTVAYSAGLSVGGIQIIPRLSGLLHSLTILDRSNRKAAYDILLFDTNPAASTTSDHSTFAFGGTDDQFLLARVSVATGDYVTVGGEAIAQKSGLDLSLQSATSNIYAVPVTSGTPTYAVGDLMFVWG